MTVAHRADSIKKVCAVGAGTMGVGTVLEFARYGYDVSFYARDAKKLADAMATIQPILEDLADNGLVDRNEIPAILARIKPTTNLIEAAKDADLVMESISENLEVKRVLFATLAGLCPANTLYATNTSALDPTQIALALSKEQRKNFVVMHGFNPPHLMPLVEVVPGAETSPETVENAFQILMRIGKKPVKLNKATPGFVVNYIQAALIWKALELHVVSSHSAEEIDTEFKQKLGVSYQALGPLELAGQDLAHLTHKHAELLLAEMRAKPPETSIAQRLQDTATIAALELVANGVASAKTVDEAFVNSLGRRYVATGPLQSADMGGLDIFKSIFETLGYIKPQNIAEKFVTAGRNLTQRHATKILKPTFEVILNFCEQSLISFGFIPSRGIIEQFIKEKVGAGHTGTKSAAKQGVYMWTPEIIKTVGGHRKANLMRGLQDDVSLRGTRRRARWAVPVRITDQSRNHFPAPARFVI